MAKPLVDIFSFICELEIWFLPQVMKRKRRVYQGLETQRGRAAGGLALGIWKEAGDWSWNAAEMMLIG